MNDEQLERALVSVGKSCFIEYYQFFTNMELNREDLIEILRKETNYTEKSCNSRSGHARRIVKSNRTKDALKSIIASNSQRVGTEIIELAQEYLTNL
jgi:N-glycosylase/DNA lyase